MTILVKRKGLLCETVKLFRPFIGLLSTKTGSAEIKLLRQNLCKYSSGKVKEKFTARDTQKNLPKTVKKVSITDPELLSIADFPSGSFIAGKLCGLAISHALGRLRERCYCCRCYTSSSLSLVEKN